MRLSVVYFILSVLILSNIHSQAANANSHRFDAVDQMFESGKSFNFSDNSGWYSGRCWRPYSENAQNGLLVMEQRKLDGPAFSLVRKFSIYQFPAQPTNFFDAIPSHPQNVKQRSEETFWPELISYDFSNDWMQLSKLSNENERYSIAFANLPTMVLRRSFDDNYFVAKRGESLNCYFFKKLHKSVKK